MDGQAEEVGRKVRFLLQTQGIPYSEAAERLGLPDDHFQDIVDGNKIATLRVLKGLAELCNVKVEFFTGKKEDGPPGPDDRPEISREKTHTEPPAKQTPKRKKHAPKPARKAGPASTPSASTASVEELAAKVQALVECLVERRIFTPLDYKRKLKEVTRRRKAAAREKVPALSGREKR